MVACPTLLEKVEHVNNSKLSDKRAQGLRSEYGRKAKKLDQHLSLFWSLGWSKWGHSLAHTSTGRIQAEIPTSTERSDWQHKTWAWDSSRPYTKTTLTCRNKSTSWMHARLNQVGPGNKQLAKNRNEQSRKIRCLWNDPISLKKHLEQNKTYVYVFNHGQPSKTVKRQVRWNGDPLI